jgi:hypothetical protein
MTFAPFQIIEGFFHVFVEMAGDLKPDLYHLWIGPPFRTENILVPRGSKK